MATDGGCLIDTLSIPDCLLVRTVNKGLESGCCHAPRRGPRAIASLYWQYLDSHKRIQRDLSLKI